MYRQNEYFSFDEYGTSEIPEYREPCGAFYGLPYSGEDEGEMPIYVKEQLQECMPDRNLLRGEVRRPRPIKKEVEKLRVNISDYGRELTNEERARLEYQFYKTYKAHYELQRQYDLREYIKIRFAQFNNGGKALNHFIR